MRRLLPFLLGIALAGGCSAQSVGNLVELTVVDRDSGETLTPHFYRGEYWVAGRPGARYAIQIYNCGGGRLLAVTSVDGVNVISGETAGWDQTGYVFGPRSSNEITGWRKSNSEVAAFTFTASPNSYAERTGRPANVGVIGVAVFRERTTSYYEPAQVAPSAGADRLDRLNDSQAFSMPAPKLGTGHGAREWSYSQRTEFVRMQSRPDEVIRIHYDSLENLFAMGIIKRPRPAFPGSNPFPASPDTQFVPDPAG